MFSFWNITFVNSRYVNHGGIRTHPSNIRAPTGGAVATFLNLAKKYSYFVSNLDQSILIQAYAVLPFRFKPDRSICLNKYGSI